MRLRYTPRAFADLEDIRFYITQFDPAAAARVVSAIEILVNNLQLFPEAGYPASELDARVLHSPQYPYRIYYRIRSGEIAVLHIRHTARRLPLSGEI